MFRQQFLSHLAKKDSKPGQFHSPDISESYLCTPWKLWNSSYVCTCIRYTSQKQTTKGGNEGRLLRGNPPLSPATDPILTQSCRTLALYELSGCQCPPGWHCIFGERSQRKLSLGTRYWDGSTPGGVSISFHLLYPICRILPLFI